MPAQDSCMYQYSLNSTSAYRLGLVHTTSQDQRKSIIKQSYLRTEKQIPRTFNQELNLENDKETQCLHGTIFVPSYVGPNKLAVETNMYPNNILYLGSIPIVRPLLPQTQILSSLPLSLLLCLVNNLHQVPRPLHYATRPKTILKFYRHLKTK